MANIKIIIIAKDAYYLNNLINYLVKHLPHQYIIKAYSNLKAIKDQLNHIEKEKNTLLIIDEEMNHQIPVNLVIKPLILSSKPMKERIHKFTSGKEILHRITEKLKEIDDYTPLLDNSNTFLSIGFYSPIGGVGVSNLSLISSILLSQKNISTLFISLDINSGLEVILEKDSNNNLSKYFYYYLSEPKLLVSKLKKNIKTYKGLSYISSFDSIIDYEEISGDHLVGFFKLIKKELNYERIIIDFPSILSHKNICLMKYMERLVLVSQGRQSDQYKLEHLRNDLEKYGSEKLITKENAILLINQIRDINLLNREQDNPFNLEERGIPYSENLIVTEASDVSYKISSQFKYVLETAFESNQGGD